MSFFRIGVLITFGVFAVIGVIVFALGGLGGTQSGPTIGSVEIWGTMDRRVFRDMREELRSNADTSGITYVEKDAETYTQELVNALAAGGGPDVFLLPHEDIYTFRDKVQPIPYESYSARRFRDTFIDGADIFLTPGGVLGFPFAVDPLVMYWNRPMLSGAGVAEPPRFWDAFFTYAERVTQRTQNNAITRSAVALGEYDNIGNALPILSTLTMQAGGTITERTDNGFVARLTESPQGSRTAPAAASLRFYTEFSNPVKTVYSWSRSKPEARKAFTAGDLGVYFGFASELAGIRNANPNLDFDVSEMPQSRDGTQRLTYARMHGLVISRTTDNPNGAARAARLLTGETAGNILADRTALASARRALLADTPDDPFRSVVHESAIMGRAWIQPEPEQTATIFRDMVNTVTTGRASVNEAVRSAARRLTNLF